MKRAWWRFRLWRKRLWRLFKSRLTTDSPLREFVYVDEVSVYSLMSSRVGALPTEFTETQSLASKITSNSSLGVEQMPLKLSAGSGYEDSRSTASQVIKKSTIQSTFREFYGYERSRLALVPSDELHSTRKKNRPTLTNLSDLAHICRLEPDNRWVTKASNLTRGRLFEVDVALSPNNLFKFSAIFSTLSDIITETPDLFPGVLNDDFVTATSINRILNRLLVGLIPIEAQIIDYRSVEVDSATYVVHRLLLDQPALRGIESRPISVAGVTEQTMYWRDIRRILFADRTFRLLGRVTESGLVGSWRPIKLAEILREAVPTLTDDLGRGAEEGLAAFGAESVARTDRQTISAVEHSLVNYERLLREELNVSDSDVRYSNLMELAVGSESMQDISNRRAVFKPITEWYQANFDACAVTPERLSEIRLHALRESGFDERGVLLSSGVAGSGEPKPESSRGQLLLESEIVAIYW